jgi:hyperpolarization activated cyclic nucleotide-gated potassium channel 2
VYSSLDPKKLIQELPSQIRNELLLICYKYVQDSISILQIDDNFTATLLPHLNFLEIQPTEIIYRQDDPPTDIYFIEKGKVNFVTSDGYNLITLLEASFFGELEAFEGRNREYFAIAKEPTNL